MLYTDLLLQDKLELQAKKAAVAGSDQDGNHTAVARKHLLCQYYIVIEACLALTQWVVGSRPSRVIPKTIIKMVQTASLDRHACVRVGV